MVRVFQTPGLYPQNHFVCTVKLRTLNWVPNPRSRITRGSRRGVSWGEHDFCFGALFPQNCKNIQTCRKAFHFWFLSTLDCNSLWQCNGSFHCVSVPQDFRSQIMFVTWSVTIYITFVTSQQKQSQMSQQDSRAKTRSQPQWLEIIDESKKLFVSLRFGFQFLLSF